MKKNIFAVFLFLVSTFAQTTSETGMAFLKNGFGARNIAMGDLGVVGTNNITAINYNPALISKLEKSEIAFMHNRFLPDAATNYFAAGTKLFGLPFVIGLNSTSINDIEVRTVPGKPIAYFDVSYFVASLSTGFSIYNDLDFGLSIKYLYEGYLREDASGYAFDFGFSYTGLLEYCQIGFSIKNIGTMQNLLNVGSKLPIDYRLGISYKLILQKNIFELNLISGIQKYESTDIHLSVGSEVAFKDFLFGRFGYLSGYELKDYSIGFGIKWKGMNIDYSFLNYQIDSAKHTISINYKF